VTRISTLTWALFRGHRAHKHTFVVKDLSKSLQLIRLIIAIGLSDIIVDHHNFISQLTRCLPASASDVWCEWPLPSRKLTCTLSLRCSPLRADSSSSTRQGGGRSSVATGIIATLVTITVEGGWMCSSSRRSAGGGAALHAVVKTCRLRSDQHLPSSTALLRAAAIGRLVQTEDICQ
jgi:hypothetical protein